ncbi:AbrB/MazE/SpoVT family DNA-binding domain-containing protein [Luedemannella flava]|uniref:AbrB/MazE/SpoVT family DNA-binding domain-containing protein n=1 Tax=Luedemannella flava TaxID=349316 RepID=UPI0031DC3A1C
MYAIAIAIATADVRGRVSARVVLDALGWMAETRIAMREQCGLVVAIADVDGQAAVSALGRLQLPLPVRRRCRLDAGTRVLRVADPSRARLVLPPVASLEVMINCYYAEVFGDTL